MSALPQNQTSEEAVSPGGFFPSGFESVLDFMSDGILVIRDDRSIGYANDAFLHMWRVPTDLMAYRNDFAILNHVLSQLSDPTQFVGEIERLYQSEDVSHDTLDFKDGRVFRRRSLPLNDVSARAWIFTDITPHAVPAPPPEKASPGGLLRRLSRQMAGK